jgi:protein gp37
MGDSKIEWTDATWNPVTGCSKVSPGCAHCYAETISARFRITSKPWTPENAAENVVLHPGRLAQPLRWRRPRMVFVNSMSDLFHELIPLDFLAEVWRVMVDCPQHTFQVLTKRPERIAETLGPDGIEFYAVAGQVPCPQPNIWLGTSIENRRWVQRANDLRAAPAAVRFISAEPLLGPLFASDGGRLPVDYGTGWEDYAHWEDGREVTDDLPELSLHEVDWLIVGGESGHGARRMDLAWARDIRDACKDAGVAFFMKQLGEVAARELGCRDRKGGDPSEWPADLRVREMPA